MDYINKEYMLNLNKDDRLDDLEYNGYKILQNKNLYNFTSDSVLLANLVKAKKGDYVLDIGSGSGIIGILIAAKTNAKKIFGMELQTELFNLSVKSVKLNDLDGRVEFINAPVQNANKYFSCGSFDIVVCNPPYYKSKEEMKNCEKCLSVCRHEESLSLEEVCKAASFNVKYGGDFYLIYKIQRLEEVMLSLAANGFSVKELTFVRPKGNKPYDVVIVKSKKGGKKGLTIKDITVYEEDGKYTEEAKKLYNK